MNERDRVIADVRRRLQHVASLRLHMVALVGLTASCGLAASFLLLKLGVSRMAIRYPLAVALAYLAFLGLVFVWLRRFRLRARNSERSRESGSVLDLHIVEIPFDRMWTASTPAPSPPDFG